VASTDATPRFRSIDASTQPRRELFRCFRHHEQPTLSVATQFDVTGFRAWQRRSDRRLFASLCHVVMGAVHAVPELRQRFHGEGLGEFDQVDPAVTVARADGGFDFCRGRWSPDPLAFHDDLVSRMAAVAGRDEIAADNDESRHLVFITSLPWLAFTGITHPVKLALADVPIITVGKLVEADGRVTMPLAVQAHHALVDGLHVARFVDAVTTGLASCR